MDKGSSTSGGGNGRGDSGSQGEGPHGVSSASVGNGSGGVTPEEDKTPAVDRLERTLLPCGGALCRCTWGAVMGSAAQGPLDVRGECEDPVGCRSRESSEEKDVAVGAVGLGEAVDPWDRGRPTEEPSGNGVSASSFDRTCNAGGTGGLCVMCCFVFVFVSSSFSLLSCVLSLRDALVVGCISSGVEMACGEGEHTWERGKKAGRSCHSPTTAASLAPFAGDPSRPVDFSSGPSDRVHVPLASASPKWCSSITFLQS